MRVETTHYVIWSQISESETYRVGGWAEKMFQEYSRRFRFPEPPRGKFILRIFRSPQVFRQYLKQLGVSPSWKGVYLRKRRELALLYQRSPMALRTLLFHEGFHQFLEYYLPHVPVWFNEGLAEYFGYALFRPKKGKFLFGLPHLAHLRRLRTAYQQGTCPSIGTVLKAPYHGFHSPKNEPLYYAKSWLFIHYLIHVEGGEAINEIIRLLLKGKRLSYYRLFGHAKFLEEKLKRYLRSLWHSSGEEMYQKGMAALQIRRYEKAIHHFSDALAQNPYHPQARHYRGLAHYALKNYLESVQDLSYVIHLGYIWPATFYYRALAYLSLGDRSSAREDLALARRLDPSNPDVQAAWEKVENFGKKSKN